MGTDDYYAIEMLNTLLADGESSRLYNTLVDEKEIAMQVNSFNMPYQDPGVNIIMTFPNSGNSLEELESAQSEILESVRNELISKEEFTKLQNQIETDIVSSNQKIAQRANKLARYYTYFGNTDLINSELDRYRSVTREDIQQVAQEYFTKDNRVVLYYLPEGQK